MERITNYKKSLHKECDSSNLINYNLLDRINEVRLCLKNECWVSAFLLMLTLPDICGKIEFPEDKPNSRYRNWVKQFANINYLFPKHSDKGFFTFHNAFPSFLFYLLRNAMFHEGNAIIRNNNEKYAFIKYPRYNHVYKILLSIKSKKIGANIVDSIASNVDNKKENEEIEITINIPLLCEHICNQAEKYYIDNKAKFKNSNFTILDYY